MKGLKDFDIQGRRVLVRSSLNVPIDLKGEIEDDFRLRKSLPTIQYIFKERGKCILIGHLGRPAPIFDSKSGKFSKEESLKLIAKRLGALLQRGVQFIEYPIGEKVERAIEAMAPGEILLLENLRFYKGETENDPEFARRLSRLGDVYINDAFDANHRAHASIVGIPKYLPSGVGFLLKEEVAALEKIRENPQRPMVVIVGGAKVETKAKFLDEMCRRADIILVGNLVSQEIEEKRMKLPGSEKIVRPVDGVPQKKGAFDIGPQTISVFEAKIADAKTVFWAGPLGKIEEEQWSRGSLEIAKAILKSKAFAVAGGGDLVAFLGRHGLRDKFDHVSTGGGAMLAFLAGERLPGLEALE